MDNLAKTPKPKGGARPNSGRPKGQPNKITREIKELASEYGQEAVEKLVYIMRNSETDTAQISAAKELLDRGFGRPAQAVELAGKDGGELTIQLVRFGTAKSE